MSLAASDFRLEKSTVFRILKKGFPLFINEALWATGISLLTACYSLRGLDTVASLNIAATLHNVFNMIAVSLGTAVSILMGQKLGANLVEEAKSDVPKIQAFSVLLGVIVGGLLSCFARFFPQIYNTTPAIRAVATKFILVLSCTMPVVSYLNTCYFTIRSGGKTLITFLFDSVFMCCVNLPLAYLLSRFSPWNIVVVYAIVWGVDFVKCIIGTFILKSGSWANNMNAAPPAEPALEATAVAVGLNSTSAESDL
jgi:Na+-driven multidrug efflux pump